MELNAYRVMWLFVFFDLPTETKKDRRNASLFRKKLLQDVPVVKVLMFMKKE